MNLMLMPTQAAKQLWQRVPSYTKWSFGAAMVLGLVTHLYMLTNKLPNHDDIFHLLNCDYGTLSGRWLLPTVLQWDGNFSMPWLIGCLSLLWLALTVCLTTSLLRIHEPLACVLAAGLMVSFPTVAATFSYMFTADAYFLSLLLAAFSAYAVMRFPVMGLPLGALSLICSMGIYQSYFPVAAVLMVGALLMETLEAAHFFPRLIWRGCKCVATLGLGILCYMAVARLTTLNTGLSDYMGISSMGSVSLADLPALIVKCYTGYEEYFLTNPYNWYADFLPNLLYLALATSLVLVLTLAVRRQVGIGRGLLALVLLALYPLAGNLIHIMVGGAEIHHLMIYGMVFVPVLAVALVNMAAEQAENSGSWRRTIQALASWLIIAVMVLTTGSYIVTDNKAYLRAEISFNQISAYGNRLINAIESTDGYTTDTTIVFYGTADPTTILDPTPELADFYLTGYFNMGTYRTQYSFIYLLKYYLGLPNPVYSDSNNPDMMEPLLENDIVQNMPTYPAAGSIQMIDGQLVVKMGE